MNMFRRFVLALSAGVLALGLNAPASAKESWKLATAAQPGSVLYDIVMKFINDANKALAPDITIEYLLVGNEQETHQQVVRGRLQLGASSFAGGAIAVPEGAVFNTPYLWKNDEERIWVTDNLGVPIAKRLYAEKGMELLLARRRMERRGLHHSLSDTGEFEGPENAGLAFACLACLFQVVGCERCADAPDRVLAGLAERSGPRW